MTVKIAAPCTDGAEERGVVQFGATEITYTITRSPRRKRTIAITLGHGVGVLVAAPVRTSAEEIRQVVLKRAAWIVRNATEEVLCPRPREYVSGERLPYLGQEAQLVVEHAHVRRISVELEHTGFRIAVPARLDGEVRRGAIESAVVAWYRARAAEYLRQRVAHWVKVGTLAPTRILVRDQRRRWGSCSADGTLRFNWRLVLAPPPLIDYVVVHELAHLRVRNHSSVFWAEMARFMPDYKTRRSALKDMGLRLDI